MNITAWAYLPTEPAATFAEAMWWPVLEGPNHPPLIIRGRGCYTNHASAFAIAQDVSRVMLDCARRYLQDISAEPAIIPPEEPAA